MPDTKKLYSIITAEIKASQDLRELVDAIEYNEHLFILLDDTQREYITAGAVNKYRELLTKAIKCN